MLLASILVGVANAEDAPSGDDVLSAVAQGDADAQWRLGSAYHFGTGVPLDFVAAYAWLNLAAAQGHEEGADSRDGLAESMTAEQVADAQRMARELWGRIEGDSPAAA